MGNAYWLAFAFLVVGVVILIPGSGTVLVGAVSFIGLLAIVGGVAWWSADLAWRFISFVGRILSFVGRILTHPVFLGILFMYIAMALPVVGSIQLEQGRWYVGWPLIAVGCWLCWLMFKGTRGGQEIEMGDPGDDDDGGF